jgi:hypothetical protein
LRVTSRGLGDVYKRQTETAMMVGITGLTAIPA